MVVGKVPESIHEINIHECIENKLKDLVFCIPVFMDHGKILLLIKVEIYLLIKNVLS